jgi:DNA invertase Pin-like site-specific DNA recombinase
VWQDYSFEKGDPTTMTEPQSTAQISWEYLMPKKREIMAGYIRESDITLANSSTTIESAAKAIREYGKREGYIYNTALHEYKESISASVTGVPYFQRPKLMEMLKAAERGEFTVLVITEVRALSRRGAGEVFLIYDALQKAGVRLETITEKFSDDPMGEMTLTWKATYARLEREQSYLRMQRGKMDRVAIGQAPNGCPKPPYGYQFVNTAREVKGAYEFNHTIVYVDPITGEEWSEYKVVVFIFDLLKQGESLYGVERILNEKGIPPRTPPRKGGIAHWRAGSIANMLNQPIYVGEVWANRLKQTKKVNRNGETKKSHIVLPKKEWIRLPDAPAYIDRETWEVIKERIAANRSESLRNNKHESELGLIRAGYCRCGICGRTMTVSYPSEKQAINRKTPAYRCQQRSIDKLGVLHNHTTFITLSIVDNAVREKIREALQDISWLRQKVAKLREDNKPAVNPDEVYATIASLQAELDNLFELARYATKNENREKLGLLMQDLERQQREADASLYDIEDEEKERAKIEAEIVKFEKWANSVAPSLTDPDYLATASYEDLRLAVRILGIVVTVFPVQGDHPFRFNIDLIAPHVLAKVKPNCVPNQP